MDDTCDGPWVLVTTTQARPATDPLVAEHGRRSDVVEHVMDRLPGEFDWPALVPAGARGVLLVGDRRRAPSTCLPGLFVTDADGRPVPAGWVPATRVLPQFAGAACAVQRRSSPGPVAVLGQRSPRYQRLSERLTHHLGDVDSVRWGAERVTREDLVDGLGSGLGLAMYLGHGRPTGWAGYRGLRAEHLAPVAARPLGALLSVTCWTASRWRTGTSFAEQVVLMGVAAASMGAVRPVLHLDSTRVVVALAAAVRRGVPDVAQLLRHSFLDSDGAALPEAASFRLCGDPLALLASTENAATHARGVFAPAPDWHPAVPTVSTVSTRETAS